MTDRRSTKTNIPMNTDIEEEETSKLIPTTEVGTALQSTALAVVGITAMVTLVVATVMLSLTYNSSLTQHQRVLDTAHTLQSLYHYMDTELSGNMTKLTDELLANELQINMLILDLIQEGLNTTRCQSLENITLLDEYTLNLEGNLTLMEDAYYNLEINITSIITNVNTLMVNITSIQSNINWLTSRAAFLQTQLQSVQANLSTIVVRTQQLNVTATVDQLDTTLDEIGITLLQYQNETMTYENDIADVQTTLDGYNTTLEDLVLLSNFSTVRSQIMALNGILDAFTIGGELITSANRSLGLDVLTSLIDNSNTVLNLTLPDPTTYWIKKFIRLLWTRGQNATVTTSKGAIFLDPIYRPASELIFTPNAGWIILDTEVPTFFPYEQFGSKLQPSSLSSVIEGFGSAVALSCDGATLLVGATGSTISHTGGSAWIYERECWNCTWTNYTILVPNVSLSSGAKFGYAVALSCDGKTAAVSAPFQSGNGAVWVFVRIRFGVWAQQSLQLNATDFRSSAAAFGTSVSFTSDGNTLVIGGPMDGSTAPFAGIWFFVRENNVNWVQSGGNYVNPPPSSIANPAYFGCAVSITGDGGTLLYGAYDWGSVLGDTYGAAFVSQVGISGTQLLLGPGPYSTSDERGYCVSISADARTAAVGAPGYNVYGAVFVFFATNGVWDESPYVVLPIGALDSSNKFGRSVQLSPDGNMLIVGAYQGPNYGDFWTFVKNIDAVGVVTFNLVSTLHSETTATEGQFGFSVASSSDGSTTAIGANNDNSGIGSVFIWV